MTRIITDEEFVKAFDAAVEERGRDFQYPENWKSEAGQGATCLYNLEDGTPACMFGLAFHKLGLAPATGVVTDILDMTSTIVDDEDLSRYDDMTGADPEGAEAWRDRADVEFQLSWKVRSAAQAAQIAQDTGNTWGSASDVFYRRLDGEAPGAD